MERPILKKIHVLTVDDSPLMQAWLQRILSSDPEIGKVTGAQNPFEAMLFLQSNRPDVMTLDVEMPGMDGISFLKKLMSLSPLPVVMVSAYTQENCQTTIKALSLGAVDFIPKPGPGFSEERDTFPQRLLIKVKEAAQARIVSPLAAPAFIPSFKTGGGHASFPSQDRQGVVIGIGASTGGTQALNFICSQLPKDMPPLVIVQHMPPQFTGAFADHLNQISPLTVREARAGDRLKKGLALVIPGGKHGLIKQDPQGLFLVLNENPPVNNHRPSVDSLFLSLTETVREKGIGVLLTGMGEDGARGLLALRKQGGSTMVQDETTSTIFGMPQAAIRLGAAQAVLPLPEIPAWLIKTAGV
jgi:two-component system, chemotaxis family, protein-glutamate methylesterase/glutaminase